MPPKLGASHDAADVNKDGKVAPLSKYTGANFCFKLSHEELLAMFSRKGRAEADQEQKELKVGFDEDDANKVFK